VEIASLVVRIGADMADLITESKKVNQSFTSMESTVKSVGKAFAAYFSGQMILGAVGAVLDLASALTDLSAKTGIGVEALQELKFAGAQVGVTLDQITGGISQMQNRLASGDKSAASALKELGLTFRELQAMNPDEQFRAIAAALQGIVDPAERVRLAMDLFGKAGADLLPLLTSNLEAVSAEAHRLGLVLDGDTVKAFDDLGDTWDMVKTAGLAVLADVIRPLVPAMKFGADMAIWYAEKFRDLVEWIHKAVTLGAWTPPIDPKGIQSAEDLRRVLDGVAASTIKVGTASEDTATKVGKERQAFIETTTLLDRLIEANKKTEAHQQAIVETTGKLWGKDLIARANDYVTALSRIGDKTPLVASEAKQAADTIKAAMDLIAASGDTASASLVSAYNRAKGFTAAGLLPSKAMGSTAGALGILPGEDLGAGDQTLKAYNDLDAAAAKYASTTLTLTQQNDAWIASLTEGNSLILDTAGAVDTVATSWQNAGRAAESFAGQVSALAADWIAAYNAAGIGSGSEFSGLLAHGGVAAPMGIATGRWRPEGFAGGTDGYQYFGAGTPAILHGWEKVTPKGAGGGEGASVVSVNMSGLLISSSPAGREEVRRLVNDTIASGIKRSRKFSL
jgi:hypothetical protein